MKNQAASRVDKVNERPASVFKYKYFKMVIRKIVNE